MRDRPQTRSRTVTCFEQYLEELGDLIGDEQRRAELEIEFRRALRTLIRHQYESTQNLLQGHQGIELVHETLTRILHEGLGPEPGALMRLVSRVGHRLFRSRVGLGLSLEESRIHPAPQVPDSDLEDLSLDKTEKAFLRTLLDHERHKKGNGRFHYEKLALDLGISAKVLRRRIRVLLQTLGQGHEYQAFWFKRLGEASLELLRIRTEEELGDLLGSRLQTQRRLRFVLSRLRSYGAASSLHPDLEDKVSLSQALRLLRLHQRKPVIPCDALARAARLLGADPLALDLIEAERLRAHEEPDQALTLLQSWHADALPPRRSLLLRLARARCLEKLGRATEASDQLEASEARSRNDLLFQYNRFVLARLADLVDRADAAQQVLRQSHARRSLSPLLLRGIRLALEQGAQ